ncbi:MAG: hypothetical protein ACE5FA_03735 [Dehalococcoidia bacterium]
MTRLELVEILKHLEISGFYGSLEIMFKDGKIVHCRKAETLMSNEFRPKSKKDEKTA